MAAAAIPIAASALAPEAAGLLGSALGASTLASLPGWLLPAVAGAGMGGIGSLLTGSNPLKGALLGGVGGGISSALGGSGGLGSLFNSSSAGGANEVLSPAAAADAAKADAAVTGGAADASQYASPQSNGGLFGSGLVGRLALPTALAGGAYLLDQANRPTTLGPPMPQSPSNNGKMVAPLNRTSQSVDPNSYFTSAGNRNFYQPYSLTPQFMAKGGPVGLGNGLIANGGNKNPTPYPVMGRKRGVVRMYADGGSASASTSNIPVRGPGDGRSDSIPAMLSDGEFIMSAPAVSAFGNGSNDAGAKKLAKIQKGIMSRHYSGGKPKKALGLGSYAMH